MCTDVLRQAVEAHDLLGFQFDLLWSAGDWRGGDHTSIARFFGEAGRQINIAAKEAPQGHAGTTGCPPDARDRNGRTLRDNIGL